MGRDLGIERPDRRRRGLRNRAGALWVGPAFHPLVLWSAGLTVSIYAPSALRGIHLKGVLNSNDILLFSVVYSLSYELWDV